MLIAPPLGPAAAPAKPAAAALPASQLPLWADTLPDGHSLMIEDAGHLVLQEKPESLKKIGDFLAA